MAVQLRLLYWNPGGVRQHLPALTWLVRGQDVHVLLLGETKLRPGLDVAVPNYAVYRRDEISRTGYPYRGTAIAVRRDVVHDVLPLPPFTATRSIGAVVNAGVQELRLFAAYLDHLRSKSVKEQTNIGLKTKAYAAA